jgi:RHS repeat-associated protein
VSQLENGCAGTSCTPALETYTYNNRLQATAIQLGTTSNSSQYASLTYNYNLPGGTQPPGCPISPGTSGNNGNVTGYTYTDAVNSGFSHSAFYVYDSLNRLACAQATGNSTYNLAFTYDRYGNMACSQNSYTNGPCPEWTYNSSTSQLTTSGCAYDAAGNTTTDCSTAAGHTFQWDAEGRVSSVDSGNTYAFTYNAVGNRVQWAYPAGVDQHMFDPWGNWLGNYGAYSVLWWGRTFLAAYEGSETYLNHLNGIGSTTMFTNHAGTPAEDMLFYLWGDVWQSWGTGGYNFANQPFYDTNTYTSPSMFRFYSMGLGRWLSPDPMGGDASNPQSLNRYAYALNNPTTLTDPLGLASCPPGTSEIGPGQCSGNALALFWFQYGLGLVGGASAWDEFGLMEVGTTPAGPSVTYTYQYLEEWAETVAQGYDAYGYYIEFPYLVAPPTLTPVGVIFSSSDPGIMFTSTGPTTASFVSAYSFSETAQKLSQAGFVKNPQDYVNFFHLGALDLRDVSPFCSIHLDLDKASGQRGAVTTGAVHLDTVNPWVSSPVPSLTGGTLTQPLGHTLFDIAPGVLGFNTASSACL